MQPHKHKTGCWETLSGRSVTRNVRTGGTVAFEYAHMPSVEVVVPYARASNQSYICEKD